MYYFIISEKNFVGITEYLICPVEEKRKIYKILSPKKNLKKRCDKEDLFLLIEEEIKNFSPNFKLVKIKNFVKKTKFLKKKNSFNYKGFEKW